MLWVGWSQKEATITEALRPSRRCWTTFPEEPAAPGDGLEMKCHTLQLLCPWCHAFASLILRSCLQPGLEPTQICSDMWQIMWGQKGERSMPTLGMKKSSELRMITDRSSEGAGTGIPEKHPSPSQSQVPSLRAGVSGSKAYGGSHTWIRGLKWKSSCHWGSGSPWQQVVTYKTPE